MILLVGNWKMAPEKAVQAADLAKKTARIAKQYKRKLSVAVCVPSIHLATVQKNARVPLLFGAQTVATENITASTGLVSAAMLASYKATYCIVGHSESRARGESNEMVAGQVARLLEKKIKPILCIGERERDEQGFYLSEIKDQLESALAGVQKSQLKQIVIAYEPVWAIGSKAVREATARECCEMMIFIRKVLTDLYDEKVAATATIIYGGSVNELNARSYLDEGQAQGFLVGRVSLEPKRFALLATSLIV